MRVDRKNLHSRDEVLGRIVAGFDYGLNQMLSWRFRQTTKMSKTISFGLDGEEFPKQIAA